MHDTAKSARPCTIQQAIISGGVYGLTVFVAFVTAVFAMSLTHTDVTYTEGARTFMSMAYAFTWLGYVLVLREQTKWSLEDK